MLPQWVVDVIGESGATALPVVVVYFCYRLTCRVLAPLTIASLVVLVGGKERSERALKLVELLEGQKQLPEAAVRTTARPRVRRPGSR